MPLAETISAIEALLRTGRIHYWGVSNLDISDMGELDRKLHLHGSFGSSASLRFKGPRAINT